jgi:hypothetical protein
MHEIKDENVSKERKKKRRELIQTKGLLAKEPKESFLKKKTSQLSKKELEAYIYKGSLQQPTAEFKLKIRKARFL